MEKAIHRRAGYEIQELCAGDWYAAQEQQVLEFQELGELVSAFSHCEKSNDIC